MNDEQSHPDTETLLKRLVEIVGNARPLPMSTSVRLAKDEILELLQDALDRLPEELRQARWMLKEREEFLAKTERDAAAILEQARVRAERMVQRTEIVREAAHTAQRLVDEAKEASSRMRLEAEDYCDKKLASFEIVLERTLKTAQAGREKLRAIPTVAVGTTDEPGDRDESGGGTDEEGFFDQDVR